MEQGASVAHTGNAVARKFPEVQSRGLEDRNIDSYKERIPVRRCKGHLGALEGRSRRGERSRGQGMEQSAAVTPTGNVSVR